MKEAKRTVLIIYEPSFYRHLHYGRANLWAGIFEDNNFAYDYNTKEALIESCEKDGYNWKVIRIHRNGKRSVVKTNINSD